MKKTDKKRDNQIRQVLTQVCDAALESIDGFESLTHTVDYQHFPQSLQVICVFDTDAAMMMFLSSPHKKRIEHDIAARLAEINVKLKTPEDHIHFDTEQQCDAQHNGNWARRLSTKM